MNKFQSKYIYCLLLAALACPFVVCSQEPPDRSISSCYDELLVYNDKTRDRIDAIADEQKRFALEEESKFAPPHGAYRAFINRAGFFETPVTIDRAKVYIQSQSQAMTDHPGYEKLLYCMLRIAVSQDTRTPLKSIVLKPSTSPATSKGNQIPVPRTVQVPKDNYGDDPKAIGGSAIMPL